MLGLIRTYAIVTPKPCQDWKVAAIRDAYDRRRLRVFSLQESSESWLGLVI